jgi:hypothetical protein
VAHEYTGPMAEPARFSAEGGQSMPRSQACNADRSQVRKPTSHGALIFPIFNLRPSMKFTRSTISQLFAMAALAASGAAFAVATMQVATVTG